MSRAELLSIEFSVSEAAAPRARPDPLARDPSHRGEGGGKSVPGSRYAFVIPAEPTGPARSGRPDDRLREGRNP
jgi:hypothetical protein